MKQVVLKVGDKKSKREAVKVPLNIAENATEMLQLAKGNEAVVVRMFNRGWRIECQERSGARDAFTAGKTEQEIAEIVNGYDATQVRERAAGQPKAPKTITLPKGKKTYSAADLRALLESKGIKVEEEGEAAAAPTA